MMKIQKKHAVAAVKFIKLFLDNRYYPADQLEEILLGKVLGFGVYHKLLQSGDTKDWRGASEIKVDIKARLDLTEEEIGAILDMRAEVDADGQIPEGSTKFMEDTAKYLNKTFTI